MGDKVSSALGVIDLAAVAIAIFDIGVMRDHQRKSVRPAAQSRPADRSLERTQSR